MNQEIKKNKKIKEILGLELNSKKTIIQLYKIKIPEKIILELLMLGQLGKNKKLLSSKKANTIYDKILSEYLLKETLLENNNTEQNPQKIEQYKIETEKNKFLLINYPHHQFIYEYYELFENKIYSDTIINYSEISKLEPKTAGAFFSLLLGLLETDKKLQKRTFQKRKGITVIRIINKAPLGTKLLREIGRKILYNKIKCYKNLKQLINEINKTDKKLYETIKKTTLFNKLNYQTEFKELKLKSQSDLTN